MIIGNLFTGCSRTSKCLLALLVLSPLISMIIQIPNKVELRPSEDVNALRRWVADHEGRDVELPKGMLVGLATAPAHVEDDLNDAWLAFAREGGVAAWHNAHAPEDRLLFWSRPEDDLDVAGESGADVLRLGVDWSRLFASAPMAPVNESQPSPQQQRVLDRYREILGMVKERGMKVMVTLFHHSLPPWSADLGGWTSERTVDDFVLFSRWVADAMGDLVDYWTVFNEPHVYMMLTHCAGVWPPGIKPNPVAMAACMAPGGAYTTGLKNMATAHGQVYHYIKQHAATRNVAAPDVGAAHHVNVPTPYYPWDSAASAIMHDVSTFFFPDLVSDRVDFLGVNFYGQELLEGADIKISPDDEYSEAGRGVYPDGLYHALVVFHRRYGLPLWVTENGVADSTDRLRGPYLHEHLLAVSAAAAAGVDMRGYLFWTISDNWEWADGYCPKFGIAEVMRDAGNATVPLPRRKRPSFELFHKAASSKIVTAASRDMAWGELMEAARSREQRPICRNIAAKGGMTGAQGLDEPQYRAWVERDWRLGHYRHSGLPWHSTPSAIKPVKSYLQGMWSGLLRLLGDAPTGVGQGQERVPQDRSNHKSSEL